MTAMRVANWATTDRLWETKNVGEREFALELLQEKKETWAPTETSRAETGSSATMRLG